MNRKAVTAVVIIGIAVVVAIVLVADRREEASSSGSASTLSGTTIDGKSFDLADTRGKPTVINFFAAWCGPCNEEAPDLVAFANSHPEAAFVGIDTFDDPQADAQAFIDKYGITYPVVVDTGSTIAQEWGVEGIPTTVFLDASGVERERIVGGADTAAFEAALQKAR